MIRDLLTKAKHVVPLLLLCLPIGGCSASRPDILEGDRVFAEANRLYAGGNIDQAEAKLLWLIENFADNPRPYNNLGNLYAGKGENDKALAQYRRALQLNPGYLIARMNLAVLSLKQRETEEAIRLLREGEKEYPENAALQNGLGIYEIQKGNPGNAVDHFRKAIDLEGAEASYYNNLAYAYAESNEYLNEALKLAKEALKADSENGVYLDTLGWVYFKRGVFNRAKESLNEALRKDPGSEIIRSHLITVHRWIGEEEEAVGLIKDGIRMRVMAKP